MTTVMTIVGVILLIAAVFLIVAVLMQSSKSHRLSGTIAGGAETFFGKTKGATIDKKLNTLTAVVAVIFVVLVAVMYIIQPNTDSNVVADDSGNVIVEGTDSDLVDSDIVSDSDAVDSDVVSDSDAVEADVIDSAETDETVDETVSE